ncbi:hypothetical protein C8J57DRAFT_125973 [Mycena rebaudengoi]|nr:hypothetical protein C8J57DRAFT_125973 [Mycena rebaudengoi]
MPAISRTYRRLRAYRSSSWRRPKCITSAIYHHPPLTPVAQHKEGMHFCCFIAISASDAARSGHKNDRARVWLLFAPSSHLPRLRGRPDTGDGAEHEQFSETLNTILMFVRSQVKGGFWRCIFRSMEAADFITDSCNTGLKHALDVFGVHLAGSPIKIYPNPGLQVQSGIIAAVTMAEVQKDASKLDS